MGSKRAVTNLCCVNGRYRRTIGRWRNSEGKIAAKKLLLGTDRHQAEVAVLRLEQLWAEIVQQTKRDNAVRLARWEETRKLSLHSLAVVSPDAGSFPADVTQPLPCEPLWSADTLKIAEALRKGETSVRVELTAARDLAGEVTRLREAYSGLAFLPADEATYASEQSKAAIIAEFLAGKSRQLAANAAVPIPTATGQTLYAAIKAYGASILENAKPGKEWPKVMAVIIERLKQSTEHMPLERLDYNAVEKMKNYWASRPLGKRTGNRLHS